MSEELKAGEGEIKAEIKTEEVIEEAKEPQHTPVELEAMEQGWVPKEVWEAAGKDPAEWRPAKEFKERGELFKTIHQTKRDLKSTQAALAALQQHHTKVFEKAQKQALEALKQEKRAALRQEDLERVELIEDEIEQLTEQQKIERDELKQAQAIAAAQAQGPHPEFQAWVERNPWYQTDQELQDYAEAEGIVYFKRNPHKTPAEVLKHVETKIKDKFPDKFGVRRAAPNAVAAVDRTNSSRKTSSYQLSEEETKVMNDLVRAKVMTKEQYIAELKKVS